MPLLNLKYTHTEVDMDIFIYKCTYIKNSYKMDDIFQYAIQNTTIDIEKICPVLFDYLTNKNNK